MLTKTLCSGLLVLLGGGPCWAQQATELYIPIGASPGVSRTSSIIGQIVATDPQHKSLTLKDAAGTTSVTLTDQTPVWLDRTRSSGRNEAGSLADLKDGATVEVKYKGSERGPTVAAEWIKVEAGN